MKKAVAHLIPFMEKEKEELLRLGNGNKAKVFTKNLILSSNKS